MNILQYFFDVYGGDIVCFSMYSLLLVHMSFLILKIKSVFLSELVFSLVGKERYFKNLY